MAILDPTAIPLVDRQVELGSLKSIAEAALDDRTGRVVIMVGQRGVGKSRLATALAEWCAGRGMTVLSAQCIGRSAEALLPIRDALRPILGTTSRSIRNALRRSAPDLLEGVPVVGKFLAGLGREIPLGPQIGGSNPRGLYDVLSSVILKIGNSHGLCLVVEDAHVADPDTLCFLTYFFNKSRGCPAIAVVTLPEEERDNPVIDEFLSEWAAKGAETLELPSLGRSHVAEYLNALLGDATLTDSAVEFVYGFTGGNPLLLTESMRQLAIGGGIRVEAGVGRLTGSSAEIPARVDRLLEGRLRRLGERTRRFVDVAAVVGETSHELAPILRLMELDESGGLAALELACKAGILRETEDGRISFTSEMLQMVTYSELSANQRRSLHRRAGAWFEEQEQFSEAAHHFERAEDWRRMVPAAFRAAEAAEHSGLYQTALSWYRRMQTRVDPKEVFPRLCKALLVVGDWAEAERLLGALPPDESETLLLRSELCFVRGDIKGAADHALRALTSGAVENVDVLLRLASIQLYAGDFETAASYANRALEAARDSGTVNDQARCHIVRGACQLYNGDVDGAERSFGDGIWLLESSREDTRNVGVSSALFGNRGFVEEIKGRWRDAEASHREALQLRRKVADARGVLESTLAVGRVHMGLGDLTQAETYLREALRLAEDLGEDLQQAKIIHCLGELAQRGGDTATARRLVEDARRRFKLCGTPYDVAYTDLSLGDILRGTSERDAVSHLAAGRGAVEKKNFVLLRRLFPELGPTLRERIHAGLLAYAGGDALGLPWEGRPPTGVSTAELERLPGSERWPSGATSDDTALTLLVCEHLAQERGLGDPARFLESLAARAESIPGLGPSTTRAIEHFKLTGRPDTSGSNTNGAPMRALPVGWALPPSAVGRRREWTLALTRMTHSGPQALTAACVMAACASWAIEGASPALLLDVAIEEAGAAGAAVGGDTAVADALRALGTGQWLPPPAGITLDPAETVTAVLHCCLSAGGDLVPAIRLAVGLGGDTDTVAALVGGLLGCRHDPSGVAAKLTWLDRVAVPPPDQLLRIAAALAGIRLTGYE